MRKINIVYIGIGTNLGDRAQNINQAIDLIKTKNLIHSISLFYKSEPWGFESNNHFLNCVIKIETEFDPEALFIQLKKIENQLGRIKTNKTNYEDRAIDLDILFYNQLILETPTLTIPHKEISNRRFVLEPMCEIASKFVHPVFNKKMIQLLNECDDKSALEQISMKM